MNWAGKSRAPTSEQELHGQGRQRRQHQPPHSPLQHPSQCSPAVSPPAPPVWQLRACQSLRREATPPPRRPPTPSLLSRSTVSMAPTPALWFVRPMTPGRHITMAVVNPYVYSTPPPPSRSPSTMSPRASKTCTTPSRPTSSSRPS